MPQTQSLMLFITSSSSSFLLAQILRLNFSQISPIASRIAFRFSTLSPYACFSKNFIIFTVNSCASRSKALRSTSEGRIFSQADRNFLKSSRHRLSMRFDYDRQTKSQLFSISGSPPVLMELQKNWQSSTNMPGEHGLPLKVFFFIPWNTFPRSSRISSRNRGRISLSFTCDMFCSLRSSSTGRMSMKQSRYLKKVVRSFRILFLRTTISLLPFCVLRAFSRYSLGVIVDPCSSSRRRAKSRTSHRKVGKQLMISCISRSPPFCSILLRFVMRLRFCTAFSSMLPTLLQTKQEESSMAIRKIFVSVCSPSSSDPSPSVSITMYCMVGSVGLWSSSGHTHSPLVQALMVGPTSKPEF